MKTNSFIQQESNQLTLLIVLIVCGIFSVSQSWHHFLDDAFIHLRYAENLSRLGIFSYNGRDIDFGISSPGYAIILSMLVPDGVAADPMMPKYTSVFAYGILVCVVSILFFTEKRLQLVYFVFLAALVSPSAIRWLTDGMETSIVALLAVAIAWFLNRAVQTGRRIDTLFLLLVLTIAPLFRIEFFALTLFALIMASWSVLFRRKTSGTAIVATLISPVPACVFYWTVFGSILPDTAGAKALGMELRFEDVFGYILSLIRAHMASPLFASLLFATTLLSLVWSWRVLTQKSKDERSDVLFELFLIASMLLSFLALLVFRGQVIQGIRHFIWIEVFTAAFLLFSVSRRHQANSPPTRTWAAKRSITFAFAFLALVVNYAEYRIFKPVFDGRSETFLSMRAASTEAYRNRSCVAYDVGFFGYFYGCDVFDINGLVSGPEIAAMTRHERLQLMASRQPELLFVNQTQLDTVLEFLYVPRSEWRLLAEYDFPNASGNTDTHYLLAAP